MRRGELATCVRCGELPRWDRSLTELCVICFRCDLARADERRRMAAQIRDEIKSPTLQTQRVLRMIEGGEE